MTEIGELRNPAGKLSGLRAVVAVDEALLRVAIARLLSGAGVEVPAVVGDADVLAEAVRRTRPDVAVIDLGSRSAGGRDGVSAAISIRQAHPAIAVLVLCSSLDKRDLAQIAATGAGGLGYILKLRIADVQCFLDAVMSVASGGSAPAPDAARRQAGSWQLTERERDVLALMAEGRSNLGIAAALGLSQSLVERCVTAVFAKLALGADPQRHRRVSAVLAALRER